MTDMPDDLRTSIEAVVDATIKRGTDCDAGPGCAKCIAAHVADAVIRELQLTVLDDGDGIIVGVMHETHESRYCTRCGIPHNTECLRGQK